METKYNDGSLIPVNGQIERNRINEESLNRVSYEDIEPLDQSGNKMMLSPLNLSEGVKEEKIYFENGEGNMQPAVVMIETLYSAVEELPVFNEATVCEEEIEYCEPIKPNYVCEEGLFDAVEEERVEEAISELDEDDGLVPDDIAVTLEDTAKIKREQKTFRTKMSLADEVLQSRYNELKNYILRYKKIKSRVSNKFDSINKGRIHLFKLSIAGKTLKLFLNMDINSVDAKIRARDVSEKVSYAEVPVYLPIKSNRAMKYAKSLIDQVALNFELKENVNYQEVDYVADLLNEQ